MIVGGREFSDIYDLVGIRILVDDDRDCYSVLGVLHSRWNPVLGPVQGLRRDAEVQHVPVAAHDGDRPAGQAGRAADPHLRACTAARSTASPRTGSTRRTAAPASTPTSSGDVDDMAWVRQLLDWQSEVEDPGEFLESLRFEINRAEVYVFTPRGDVIALPTGATPVDFAYAVHTEVGHHTIGARVNGRLVPLESTLENGDVVEVFTSKAPNAGPSRDWLTFVKSPRARTKIRQWFTKERREEAIEQGKDADRQADAQGGPAPQAADVPRVADAGRRRTSSSPTSPRSTPRSARATSAPRPSYAGSSTCTAATTARRRTSPRRVTDHRPPRPLEGASRRRRRRHRQGRRRRLGQARQVLHAGAAATRSSASSPRAAGSRCTARDCTNADAACAASPSGCSRSSGRRPAQSTFLVNIQVEALDRARLLSDITMVLSDAHVNILSANLHDHPRPGRQEPVHLRDGRPQAPRPRPQGRPLGPRRLRRLPRHPVAPSRESVGHAVL